MKYGVKFLSTESSLNALRYIPNAEVVDGEDTVLMFQLWDAEKDHRYIPSSGYSISVIFNRSVHADGTVQTVTVTPTVKWATDKSIFSVSLTAAQVANVISGSFSCKVTE